MVTTGVGSHYVFLYNRETNTISTKDGSQSAFVDFYNGDYSESTLQQLNGFDRNIKYGMLWEMQRLQSAYDVGLLKKSPDELFGDSNICELTVDVVKSTQTQYSINGERIFELCVPELYTKEEEEQMYDFDQPFKTRQSKGYDPYDNSINIAVGDKYNLGNGYCATVRDYGVFWDDFGKGTAVNDRKMNQFVGALNNLIKFADHIAPAGFLDDYTSIILEFLKQLGVDTDREFTINGTKCEVKDGMIREVGSYNGVPKEIYEKMLKRYEDSCLIPLSENETFAKYFNKQG